MAQQVRCGPLHISTILLPVLSLLVLTALVHPGCAQGLRGRKALRLGSQGAGHSARILASVQRYEDEEHELEGNGMKSTSWRATGSAGGSRASAPVRKIIVPEQYEKEGKIVPSTHAPNLQRSKSWPYSTLPGSTTAEVGYPSATNATTASLNSTLGAAGTGNATANATAGAGDKKAAKGGPLDMDYHNGDIMWQPINVYILWLGKNFTASQKNLVKNFVRSISPPKAPAGKKRAASNMPSVADWWSVNTMYYDTQKRLVSNKVVLKGEYHLTMASELVYSAARKAFVLTGEESVAAILKRVLNSRTFPADPNGVYSIISDNNIFQVGVTGNAEAKFCEKYCGWHDAFDYTPATGNPVNIKFTWNGVATTLCPRSCISYLMSAGQYESPSGDMGIQGAISILAHELAEAASDPKGDAWWSDRTGDENCDKCQWNYNNTRYFTTPNGRDAVYNMEGLDGTRFLVQGNWDFKTGACSVGTRQQAAKRAPRPKRKPGPKTAETSTAAAQAAPGAAAAAAAQRIGAGGVDGADPGAAGASTPKLGPVQRVQYR